MLIKQGIVDEKSYIEQLAKSMQNNLHKLGMIWRMKPSVRKAMPHFIFLYFEASKSL